MRNLSGTQLGPYRLVEPIGEGGMATVYRAYQPSMDRFVALKILPAHYATDPSFMERFRQEARVIARLEHPNIIPVHDFGEQDNITYLVMRYLQAGSLKDILRAGPLPLADTVRVTTQVAGALDYAHRQGIIHRDIKPANVLIDADGNAFLTDFGIAKMLEGNIGLTATGGAVGTPAYMAPEQSLGEPVDARSDIYALGVTLYEMLTGRAPYDADTPVAVILKHLHEPLPLPRQFNPDIPEQVERVVLRAMAKARNDRFASASEMAADLNEAFASTAKTRPSRASELRQRAAQTALLRAPSVVTEDLRERLVIPATPPPATPPSGPLPGAPPPATPPPAITARAEAGPTVAAPGGGRGMERSLILVAGGAIVVAAIAVLLLVAQSGLFRQPLPATSTPSPTAFPTVSETLTPTPDAVSTADRQTLDAIISAFQAQTVTAEAAHATGTALAAGVIATTSPTDSPTPSATLALTPTPTATATPDHRATADRATLLAALSVFASQTAVARSAHATETAVAAWTDTPTPTPTATPTATPTPVPTLAPAPTKPPMPDTSSAEPVFLYMEQNPPLYAEDFEAGAGAWRLERDAVHVGGRLRLLAGGAATCDCWGVSEVAIVARLRLLSVKSSQAEAVIALGPHVLRFLLSPDAPQAILERDGEALATYALDPAFLSAGRDGFPVVVVAREGQVAALLNEKPALAARGLKLEPGALRVAAVDAVLEIDDFALWDLAPPSLAAFDHGAAEAFAGQIQAKVERTSPDAEDHFDAATGDWGADTDLCAVEGGLGLCSKGGRAAAAYLPLTAHEFAFQVDVSVQDASDGAAFFVDFGGDAARYRFAVGLAPGGYPSVALRRLLPEREAGDLGGGRVRPIPLSPGAPFTLSAAIVEGRLVVYLNDQVLYYAEGIAPVEGPVELGAEDASLALDNFRLWRFGAPPPVNVAVCPDKDTPEKRALCLWRPGVPEVRREFDFIVDAAAWSPDGRRLVVAGRKVGGSPDRDTRLWLVDVACYHKPECLGEPQPLAHDRTGNAGVPDWSPDGAWIAFHNSCAVSLVRPDGSDLHTVWWPTAERCAHWPVWSPDGTRLAALVSVNNARAEVVVIDPMAATETTLYEMDLKAWPGGAGWSPDGEWVAFAFYEEQPARILAVPVKGGEPKTLDAATDAGSDPWSWFASHTPRWDQDPASLPEGPLYTPDEFRLRAIPVRVGQCRAEGALIGELCVWPEGFPELRRQFDFSMERATWSPDGRRLVMQGLFPGDEAGQDTRLWVVDVTCYDKPGCVSEPRPLAHRDTGNVNQPEWSPDGAWIAFHDNCRLSLVRPDGSDYHVLWKAAGRQCVAVTAFSPDASRLAAYLVTERNGKVTGGEVAVFNLADGSQTTLYAIDWSARPGEMAWSPDGERVVAFFGDQTPEPFLVAPAEGGEPEALKEFPDFWRWVPWYWPRWGQRPLASSGIAALIGGRQPDYAEDFDDRRSIWPHGGIGGAFALYASGGYVLRGGESPAIVVAPVVHRPTEFVLSVRVAVHQADWAKEQVFSVSFGGNPQSSNQPRYVVAITGGAMQKLRLIRLVGEDAQNLASAELPLPMREGNPVELTVAAAAGQVRVYLDGALALETREVELFPALFGLWVAPGNTVEFDDFRVWW